jgi:hypothetical protein
MSISNLFVPNTYNLFAKSINFSSQQTGTSPSGPLVINVSPTSALSQYSLNYGSTVTNQTVNSGTNPILTISFATGSPNQGLNVRIFATGYTRSGTTLALVGSSMVQDTQYLLRFNSNVLTAVVALTSSFLGSYGAGTIGQSQVLTGNSITFNLFDSNATDITSWTYKIELYSEI